MDNFRILIVDDDEVTVKLLSKMLEKKHEVFGVMSSHEAMKLIQDKAINLVITDICMPDMGGLELMRWIKKYNGSIQIIAITAQTTLFNVLESHRLGCCDLFFKPLGDHKEFMTVVEKIKKSFKRWKHLAAIADKV